MLKRKAKRDCQHTSSSDVSSLLIDQRRLYDLIVIFYTSQCNFHLYVYVLLCSLIKFINLRSLTYRRIEKSAVDLSNAYYIRLELPWLTLC